MIEVFRGDVVVAGIRAFRRVFRDGSFRISWMEFGKEGRREYDCWGGFECFYL